MPRQSERITDAEGRPILFPDTAICADCGEPYHRSGFTSRCKKRHEEVRKS